jgi:hypothetical protein
MSESNKLLLQPMPSAATGTNTLPVGSSVLLEARRRRQLPEYRSRPAMAFDSAALQSGSRPALVEALAHELLDAGVDHRIGIGPLVTRPPGAMPSTPTIYFAIAGCDEEGLFTLLAGAEDRAGAADLRDALIARLVREWPPVTVWAVDDELKLAEWALRQWPDDPAATTIVATITAERKRG